MSFPSTIPERLLIAATLIGSMSLIGCGHAPTEPSTAARSGNMVLIKSAGSTFTMGDASDKTQRVSLTRDFWIDTAEVTQREYASLVGETPWKTAARSYGIGDAYPAWFVSWFDAVRYCMLKSDAANLAQCYDTGAGRPNWTCDNSKSGYRLPTEAEWEFACRGGSATDFFWGKDFGVFPSTLSDTALVSHYAVWIGSAGNGLACKPIGAREPNGFGLYDIAGNVWEWCQDWSGPYASSGVSEPVGPVNGTERVARGGSWVEGADKLQSWTRASADPSFANRFDVGFRTVRTAVGE